MSLKVKRLAFLVLCVFTAAVALSACAAESGGGGQAHLADYKDFIGKGLTVGVESGDTFYEVAEDTLIAGEVKYYSTMPDIFAAVSNGQIDAAVFSDIYIGSLKDSGIYDEYDYYWLPEAVYVQRNANVFFSSALRDEFNEWLAGFKASGELQRIVDFWTKNALPAAEQLPKFTFTGENGVIRLCDTGNYTPLTYMGPGGEFTGLDSDIIGHFCVDRGYIPEYSYMAYDAVLPYVSSGKADISASTYAVTGERDDALFMGEPTFSAYAVIAVKGSGQTYGAASAQTSYADFMGKRFAAVNGSVFDKAAEKYFNASERLIYNSVPDEIEAVKLGKADAMLLDEAAARFYIKTAGNGELAAMTVPIEDLRFDYGAFSPDTELLAAFDGFVAELKASGIYDDMVARWFTGNDGGAVMPEVASSGASGVLRVVLNPSYPPFVYLGGNSTLTGFDVELARRFAASLGKIAEFSTAEMGGLINEVNSAKADMSMTMYITDERKAAVPFSNAYYTAATALIYRGSSGGGTREWRDFIGKKLALPLGYTHEENAAKTFLNPEILYFEELNAALQAVRDGKADFTMEDAAFWRVVSQFEENAAFGVINPPEGFGVFDAAAVAHTKADADGFNAFLAKIRADGTFDAVYSRWMNGYDLASPPSIPVDEIINAGKNGVITVATSTDAPPLIFRDASGAYQGFEAELMIRYGASVGKAVKFADMDFNGIMPYVTSGKADFGVCEVFVTEERSGGAIFTDSYYSDTPVIIYLKDAADELGGDGGWRDFIGKTLAMSVGSTQTEPDAKRLLNAEILWFNDNIAALQAVRGGEADFAVQDYAYWRVASKLNRNADLGYTVLPDDFTVYDVAAAARTQSDADSFSEFITLIKSNGVYDEIVSRWLNGFDPYAPPAMPDIANAGENGGLIVAASADYPPMTFESGDGAFLGFEAELMLRYGAYLGKTVEFLKLDFNGMLPAVSAGKADFGVCELFVTDERRGEVIFTAPYYRDASVIVYLKGGGGKAGANPFAIAADWLRSGIDKNLVKENRYMLIVNGLIVTVKISLLSQLFGTIFAMPLCWLMTRKNKAARRIGSAYDKVVSGLPILTFLLVFYYVIFGKSSISPVYIAVSTFALVAAAGIASTFKSAIDTVDKTEVEAARAIGFTGFRAFRLIVFPQALKRALPPYMSAFVELVKGTAIVGYIAIEDLTRAGDIIRSRTFDAYFPILFTALVYFAITTLLTEGVKLAFRKGGAKR